MGQHRSRLHVILVVLMAWGGRADVYLHNPRGSNNKLSEQSNNVNNNNRLFDSQNNDAGGYQIGDDCKPVCQNENSDYDENVEGAMKGQMRYYQGSELYIEWALQHSCGRENSNVICQLILQYMCDSDSPGLRDGIQRGNQNTAGGASEPPIAVEAEAKNGEGDFLLGQHEPLDFYLSCKQRERNKGLYTADRKMNDDAGATATRQNPNGNGNAGERNGLECPEERDYYPYWHPTPWHDIAVITDEPEQRCAYYQAESQNVKPKSYCSVLEFNNEIACASNGGTWQEQPAFGEDPPQCITGVRQRDNHNGNSEGTHPQYFMWKIPEDLEGRCVLRLRYNITSGDFRAASTVNGGVATTKEKNERRLKNMLRTGSVEPRRLTEEAADSIFQARDIGDDYFHVDASQNDPDPNTRRRRTFTGGPPVLVQDPIADFVKLGTDYTLQMNINTNQYGRTFQDRTHSFYVEKRPPAVSNSARIVNYNVRGRRGNIVQVYPAVEYDFVPNDLAVEEGTVLHFQWAGSDANPKGNDGNGRQGTDRSNLVQMSAREQNVPMAKEGHTLFYDAAEDPDNEEGLALVRKFAYLNQNDIVTCDQTPDANQNNEINDCQQLNGASAYFDGGLVEMKQVGEHHVFSTRNNDFSNRSQKAVIRVSPKAWQWWELAITVLGSVLGGALILYLASAAYAYFNPRSWLFARRYRPRILRWLVRPQTLLQMEEQHKQHRAKKWKVASQATGSVSIPAVAASASAVVVGRGQRREVAGSAPTESMSKPWGRDVPARCLFCVGLGEGQRLGFAFFAALNIAAFAWGYCTYGNQHRVWGVERSTSWAIAVGAGYALNVNLAFAILPSLRSLRTTLHGTGGALGSWIPVDNLLMLQTKLGVVTGIWTFVHVAAHFWHMSEIAGSVTLQPDVLGVWRLTEEQRLSGLSVAQQTATWAHITGLIAMAILLFMIVAVLPVLMCSQSFCPCFQRCGGFKIYQQVHALWPLFYLLMLLHGTSRLYVWLFFPLVCFFFDRLILTQRQRHPAALFSARLLANDVVQLNLEVPEGFAYQAGQYVLLHWRGEWHPFSLTSAPEERALSLHIRAPASYDWCSALRQRLMVGAPAAAGAAKTGSQSQPGACVEYQRLELPNGVVSRPRAAAETVKTASEREKMRQQENADAGDAVALQICGPFGAPAARIWDFDTVMVVGAGLGVTPFASILRSAQTRAQQRASILGAAGRRGKDVLFGQGSGPRSGPPDPTPTSEAEARRRRDLALLQSPQVVGSRTDESFAPPGGRRSKPSTTAAATPGTDWGSGVDVAELVRDAIRVPSRIYFYWLVRSTEELQWFCDLLVAAANGPAKDILSVAIFVTPEVDMTQLPTLQQCPHQLHVGRPRWGNIFKACKLAHPGDHIGVFLCGSASVGSKLLKQAHKRSDPPDAGPMGVRFSYFKEHF